MAAREKVREDVKLPVHWTVDVGLQSTQGQSDARVVRCKVCGEVWLVDKSRLAAGDDQWWVCQDVCHEKS